MKCCLVVEEGSDRICMDCSAAELGDDFNPGECVELEEEEDMMN